MGAYANRSKFVYSLRERPQTDYKGCTGGDYNRLRERLSPGAARFSWMSAKFMWRIDEGLSIITADRIRTHTQTEYSLYRPGGSTSNGFKNTDDHIHYGLSR